MSSSATGNRKLTIAVRHNWVQVPWALLGTVIDAAVTEKLTYNGRNGRPSERVTSVTVGAGLQWRQSWSWDDLGNAATITYPICENATCTGTAGAALPRTITNLYTNGFLTNIREGTTNHGALTYHPNRLVASIIHGNGVTDTQANDPNQTRRPASISSTAMASVYGPYKFDGAGNISDIGQHQFVYDKVSRITSYKFASGQQQGYSYDAWGNLLTTTTTIGGVPTTRTTPVMGNTNRLSGATYDPAGNLSVWGTFAYTWDAFGMMTRMTGEGNDQTHIYTAADERLWTVAYDSALGVPGNKETFRIRDLDGKVLREYQMNGGDALGHWKVEKDYVYRDGGLQLASVSPAQGVRHFTLDHLGTPMLVTGPTGNTVSTHAYYAYGEELVPQTGEAKKFTGHERDFGRLAGTTDDLDYMHARYCSPMTGRFLGVDPAPGKPRTPQSWNRYAYVLGNPLRFADPDGRDEEESFFDTVYAFLEEKISQLFPGPQGGNDPELDAALEEEGINPNIVPRNQAKLVQKGLVTASAALVAAGIVVGTEAAAGVEGQAFALVSRIHDSSDLTKAARGLSGDQQKSVDRIVSNLGAGRIDQQFGTKTLFKGVFEARAANGARVAFRVRGSTIEILAKFNKSTQKQVIQMLRRLYV